MYGGFSEAPQTPYSIYTAYRYRYFELAPQRSSDAPGHQANTGTVLQVPVPVQVHSTVKSTCNGNFHTWYTGSTTVLLLLIGPTCNTLHYIEHCWIRWS